jgi:xylan 1,4-beta-xylosidase
MLDKYGFADAETLFDEWNYFEGGWNKIWTASGIENCGPAREEIFEKQKNMIGAAFTAAAMIRMQTLPVSIATYYDGQPTALFCGLFNIYGNPRKTFYSFKAFQALYSRKTAVKSTCGAKGVYGIASLDGSSGCVLVSNYGGSESEYSLALHGLAGDNLIQVYLLDECHDLSRIYSITCNGDATLSLPLQGDSVALVKVN